MRVSRIIEWLIGFALGYLLSPFSPLILFALRTGILPYSPDLRSFNIPVLVLMGFVTIALPLGIYFCARRRWPAFAWGLLIPALAISVPSYFMTLLTPFLVNY